VAAAAPPTAVAHPDLRHLPDGSVAELNAGAEFTYDFTPAERDVYLTRGEALFAVAHDAVHPFIVFAGGVRVRAVGTAFNVRLRSDAVEILVTEGKVRVDPPGDGAARPIAVAAGQQTLIPLGPNAGRPQVIAVPASAVRQALAWRSSRIEFSRAPLAQVVEVFNRKNPVRLVIGDASIRDLQISGIYWSDDPEGFVRLLNEGLDLRAERGDGVIVLRAP
jgi:transmembrane sensor